MCEIHSGESHKVIFVGTLDVGKTSIIQRKVNGSFNQTMTTSTASFLFSSD